MKHSKYKNTGILFELLTRQITEETISNIPPKAIYILRKHFNENSFILKEYQIYHTLLNKKFEKENSASVLLETLLNAYNKLNKSLLKKEKYNLVKSIKENYDIDNFFKAKISNYKIYASIYTLLEKKDTNPIILANSKILVLEHITNKTSSLSEKNIILEEFQKSDKETKMLAYKLLLEKFNAKYSVLSNKQRSLLKEYVYNITDSPKFKDFLNKEIQGVKKELTTLIPLTDQVTQIKLNEVKNLLQPLCNKSAIHDDNVVNLMNYYELVDELKNHTFASTLPIVQ